MKQKNTSFIYFMLERNFPKSLDNSRFIFGRPQFLPVFSRIWPSIAPRAADRLIPNLADTGPFHGGGLALPVGRVGLVGLNASERCRQVPSERLRFLLLMLWTAPATGIAMGHNGASNDGLRVSPLG